MKYRDHEKIMREREKSVVAMKQRHKDELARQKHFYDGEVIDRERIMDIYANDLDRYSRMIGILRGLLVEHGVDFKTQDQIIDTELAKWNEDEVSE